jgi:hypothetical protein
VPKTLTPAPTDKRMWRKLLRVVHPDSPSGVGDGDLFVWCRHLQEYVVGDALEPPRSEYEPPRRTTTEDSPRVDFATASVKAESFGALTAQAVELGKELEEPYATLLGLLEDCKEVGQEGGVIFRQQNQGATYKSLAALAYRAGLDKAQRTRLYRIAESVPLSQRHVGHIHRKLSPKAKPAA